MSDYAKLELTATVSTNSDYSLPYLLSRFSAYTATPDEAQIVKMEVTDVAIAVPCAHLGTCTGIAVWNTSTTSGDDVSLRFTDVDANAIPNIRIPPGGFIFIPGIDPTATTTLDADSGKTVSCYVYLQGS